MRLLKQSTAANVMVLMVDSTDHVTGKTGLTLTITASKNGAAFGSISPTVTERGDGWYSLALTTGHTDTLGDLALHITGTGADPADLACYVVVRHLADLAWPATSGRSLAVESDGMVYSDVREWLGNAPLALSSQLVQTLAADIAAGAITSSEAPALANLDAAVSTRALEAGGNVAAIKAKTDNLPTDPADESLLEAAIAGRASQASVDDLHADVGDIHNDVSSIDGRIPAALVSGRIDASVGAMANDVLTAAALASDAVLEIVDSLLKRDIDQVEATSALHSLCSAVLKAVSRIRDNGSGSLQIYRTDGTTVHVTQVITTDNSLQPVKELGVGA